MAPTVVVKKEAQFAQASPRNLSALLAMNASVAANYAALAQARAPKPAASAVGPSPLKKQRPNPKPHASDIIEQISKAVQPVETKQEDTAEGAEMHEEEAEVYTEYRAKKVTFGRPHQDHVVEAYSMASVAPPDVKYGLKFPKVVIDQGCLSQLQLESIIYAGQRHAMMLPDQVSRAGFFVGDGAGVGKGRQIAGIIYDNWKHGRKRALWFSISSDLIYDARRDLRDIHAAKLPIELLSKVPGYDLKSVQDQFPKGVLFCTYNCLIAQNASGLKRLDQLISWFGEKYDGVLVFDEAHRAKNLVPERGMEPTRTGKAVLDLQSRLPNARVVYVSATGASEVRNCAYMTRLGLWGPGVSFPTFEHFQQQIERGGVGAMEMVAINMKALGMYVSRSLSFKGVTFAMMEHKLSPEQRSVYDAAAKLWQKLWRRLEWAMNVCDTNRRVVMSQYWGRHQNFFRQVLIAFKVPTLLAEVERGLADGKCAVIGLLSTGESRTTSKVANSKASGGADSELEAFVSPPQEILTSLIEQHFPTKRGDTVNPQAAAIKKELLQEANALPLPANPLDSIIDHFGVNNVAEMTGRKSRFVRDPKTGTAKYVPRSYANVTMDMVNIHEKEQFMEGKKRVAIISEAASSGVSLHADRRVPNQQQRLHFILELPWSSDKMIQQCGRTHRSNQSRPPEYILLISDIGGERRFASAVAKRLQTLGALTKGDRRAAGGINLADFNFETKEGVDALHQLYFWIRERRTPPPSLSTPDFNFAEAASMLERVGLPITSGDMVKRFFNRILGLEIGWQNALFQFFYTLFDKLVVIAKKSGTLDEGIMDIKAASIRLKAQEVVNTDRTTGAVTTHYTLVLDKGLEWRTALQIAQANDSDVNGFYMQRRSHHVILATRIANSNIRTNQDSSSVDYGGEYYYRIQTTTNGRANTKMRESILFEKYAKISKPEAQEAWELAWKASEKTRTEEIHLLAGSVLPFWSIFERHLSKQTDRVQVQRLQTDCGTRIVGVLLPKESVNSILSAVREYVPPEVVVPQKKSAEYVSDEDGEDDLDDAQETHTRAKDEEEVLNDLEQEEQVLEGVGAIQEEYSSEDD